MVLPIHDRNPVRRASVVTWALIAINVVAFLVSPVARAPLTGTPARAQLCDQQEFFLDYGAIPRELTRNEPLGQVAVVDQSGQTVCRLSDESKQPALSVLFAMFLHGGWLHLLGNMLFLFVFGNNVEDRLGRVRFLIFYLVCGYLASYGFALASPDSQTPLVGASGAIAGVLGAYLLLFPRAKVTGLLTFLFFLPVRLPAWLVLGSWFVLQYFYARGAGLSEGGGVAYLAHVIGFVAGAAYVALAGRRFRPPPRSAYYQPSYR